MVQRIDVFMPPLSTYGVLHHFTKKMYEALLRSGIKARLLEAKRDDPKSFLDTLFSDPPEYTLSFNGLLPDDQGRFFSDMIKIPHIACLVDSPCNFIPLIKSENTIITSVDRSSVDFFSGLGFSKALFLPHAVEKELLPPQKNGQKDDDQREYDVVLLSSCIDYEELRSTWKLKFSKPLIDVMDEVAEIAVKDSLKPYYQLLAEALERSVNANSGIDPRQIDFINVLDGIEMYIRGKDRVDLVNAIQNANVDVFGSGSSTKGWKKYIRQKRNIKVHDAVPFEQAIAIMKHSKIVLNSCPWIHYGAHERIFSGFGCGALVITKENEYLKNFFKDGESIVFYKSDRLDKVNHRVDEYLKNHAKRANVAENGRAITMKFHTWENRAKELLEYLNNSPYAKNRTFGLSESPGEEVS